MSGVLNPYVESWMKMVDDGYITSDMVGISSEQARNEFSNGKAAMFIPDHGIMTFSKGRN